MNRLLLERVLLLLPAALFIGGAYKRNPALDPVLVVLAYLFVFVALVTAPDPRK